jgi:transposase
MILPQKGKTINVIGFMDANGQQLFTFDKEGGITTEFIIDAIDKFKEALTKPTILVLDNARIHHSKVFQSNIEEWQEQGLYIFYLPAYSPHLNRIETLWRHTKYRWIKPQDYKDLNTLKIALDSIWDSFGVNYKINFSKNKI